MKTATQTLTAKEIKNLNLLETDLLSFDYQWINGVDNDFLCINHVRVISFSNSINRRKSYNKIRRMGLGLGWEKPQLTDEEEGIIQASKNGENPFAYTIMCGNPIYNKTCK